ncbi:MAG: A/G-specific adenine glycosylase [Bacteroidales bacterium]|nr:A/G-specific adenine glycosylase [Bacteroidales bacterium]
MQLLSKTIVNWYNTNKRELPWRDINDPYRIWISEIILQQTRVNQGMNYYLRFIERFPNVSVLACAEEDEVLKYWQGLGYYSRARNLHKAAKQIVTEFNSVFPTVHQEVLKLAGIGVYTAAAICSFAYNQPYPVVDGNVYRVLSRLFGIDTPIDSGKGIKQFARLAQDFLDLSQPGLHNQALMEFGALQCVPASPDCKSCPLVMDCRAFASDMVSSLPVKTQKVKVKERFFNYLVIEFNVNTFIRKRTGADIWKNLYEFPLIESDHLFTADNLFPNADFIALFNGIDMVNIVNISVPVKHVLTHRIINAVFITLSISNKNRQLENYIEIPVRQIDEYAVSRLIELFLESRR